MVRLEAPPVALALKAQQRRRGAGLLGHGREHDAAALDGRLHARRAPAAREAVQQAAAGAAAGAGRGGVEQLLALGRGGRLLGLDLLRCGWQS